MKNFIASVKNKMLSAYVALQNKKGEGYVDTGIKILIAVVIGSLLLTSLYGIMNTNILPEVRDKIAELFAYHA